MSSTSTTAAAKSSFGFSSTAEEIVSTFGAHVRGRTFLITGTSAGGLGAKVATSLAAGGPAHLILVARTPSKVDPVLAAIKEIDPAVQATVVTAELSDFASVRRAAKQIQEDPSIDHIDVVINNAGVMAIPKYTQDAQGYEMTLSANHLGHFLLTNLLMPLILASSSPSGARIVNVSSSGHKMSGFRFADWNFGGDGSDYHPFTAYGQSKTANILYSVALAQRLGSQNVKAYAAHPGLIFETSLATHLDPNQDWAELTKLSERNTGRATFNIMDDAPKTPAQGAAPLLAAALDPAFDARSGSYVADCQIQEPMDYAEDKENAAKLWKLSEELVGQKFDF